MAESSWPDPATSRVVNDLQYERLVALQHVDGLLGTPSDQELVFADGSALAVFVRPSRYAQLRGHGWTSGTTQLTKAIGANSSGQTRTDLVVLGLNRSTWAVTSYVKAGTPGAGAPALQRDGGDTGIFEIPLAEVTVVNNATVITAGNVIPRAWYVRADGAWTTSTTRPTVPDVGEVITEGGAKYVWTGSIWKNISEPAVPFLFAYKTADTSRATQTQADDPHLTLNVQANARYVMEGLLIVDTSDAAQADLSLDWTVPAGATGRYVGIGQPSGATGTDGTVRTVASNIDAARTYGATVDSANQLGIALSGLLITSSTAGVYAVNWARTGTAGTLILVANSWLMLYRVA